MIIHYNQLPSLPSFAISYLFGNCVFTYTWVSDKMDQQGYVTHSSSLLCTSLTFQFHAVHACDEGSGTPCRLAWHGKLIGSVRFQESSPLQLSGVADRLNLSTGLLT